MLRNRSVPLLFAAALFPVGLFADSGEAAITLSETVQVTATRLPEEVLDVPATITVVTGEELAARDVHDLAGALATVAGVAVAPGGDGGPASSVPEIMGLREFDAFLLVVDGVPWGGAFNPALPTLDLTNVERIEVLRGSAPVLYGATSFVGVVHVIHRAPEATPRELALWGGGHESGGVAATTAFGSERWRQSISASAERQGLADDRAGFDRGHALWTGVAATEGGARLRFSADVAAVRQEPGSPHPREGRQLSSRVPRDANHNPTDAKIDEDRLHLAFSAQGDAGAGSWTTTAALTHTVRSTVRGFLSGELDALPGAPNAAGYTQEFAGDELFVDGHFAWRPNAELAFVAGVDLLAGRGEAESVNFVYHVGLDGAGAPSSDGQTVVERPEFEDERLFAGAYGQALWKPSPRWLVDAGLRLNRTSEKQEGEAEAGGGEEVAVEDRRTDTRLSGALGASFLAWHDERSALWAFSRYTDAFKPAAVDFGPEAEGAILDPETARTIEGGFKGSHLGGRATWQASVYRMDFENLVVGATVDGRPTLRNAGEQRFEGLELEGRWAIARDLALQAAYASHSAKFTDFVQEFDGVPTQLRGRTLELSADAIASLGLTWDPPRGLRAWILGSYVGRRFLTKRNTAEDDPYTTLAAGLAFRAARSELRLSGENLTDERPPVAESELGESQYYLLPARTWRATWVWRLGPVG